MMFDINLFTEISKDVFVLKKTNWYYEGVEEFQLECVEYVKTHPHVVLLIFCHHQHCFTLGKGLQKLSADTGINLVDFDTNTRLDYPLFQLKRGGGLTFHYPGQVVLYPILNLTYHRLSVHDMMLAILEMTKNILEDFYQMENLAVDKTLLGLWQKNSFVHFKLASIGLAITRFNTYHGLALNVLKDESMFDHLTRMNPCGLSGEFYRPVEELIEGRLSTQDLDKIITALQDRFTQYLAHQGMTDKQISSADTMDEISF